MQRQIPCKPVGVALQPSQCNTKNRANSSEWLRRRASATPDTVQTRRSGSAAEPVQHQEPCKLVGVASQASQCNARYRANPSEWLCSRASATPRTVQTRRSGFAGEPVQRQIPCKPVGVALQPSQCNTRNHANLPDWLCSRASVCQERIGERLA